MQQWRFLQPKLIADLGKEPVVIDCHLFRAAGNPDFMLRQRSRITKLEAARRDRDGKNEQPGAPTERWALTGRRIRIDRSWFSIQGRRPVLVGPAEVQGS